LVQLAAGMRVAEQTLHAAMALGSGESQLVRLLQLLLCTRDETFANL
jgi:hypothetical protein